jgi:hypothetical protein
MSKGDTSTALDDLLRQIKDSFNPEGYVNFENYVNYPLNTVGLLDKIYVTLFRMWEGKNPIYKAKFGNENERDDWDVYRKEVLNDPVVWKTMGWEKMKNNINSIVVVDLPDKEDEKKLEGISGVNAEPYFYFIGLDSVVDFKSIDGNELEWVIFKREREGEKEVVVIDDESYQVFKEKIGGDIEENPEVMEEHGLGCCPTRFFWTTPINYSFPEMKKSPISKELGSLDNIFKYEVGNEHLNDYARWPVYSVLSVDCDFEDERTGMYCDGGNLRASDDSYLMDGVNPKKCPVCGDKKLRGAGTVLVYDSPNEENGNSDLSNPIKIHGIDVPSLEYNNMDVERRKNKVFENVTGYQGMPVNNQAVNEKQVVAIFESMETALRELQMNFEEIMMWVSKMVCRLRYNTFEGIYLSLGTEHYIMSANDVLSLYKLAKEANFSPTTLDMLEDRYYEAEYRNNPDKLARQRIINHLDPLRHLDKDVVNEMYGEGKIGFIDFIIKINLSSFVMRFERENVKLVEFGEKLNFKDKINRIRKVFEEYGRKMMGEVNN